MMLYSIIRFPFIGFQTAPIGNGRLKTFFLKSIPMNSILLAGLAQRLLLAAAALALLWGVYFWATAA